MKHIYFTLILILALSGCARDYQELTSSTQCSGDWYGPIERGKITTAPVLSKTSFSKSTKGTDCYET